ncbi:MAG: putative bifunctional diguanylate cyclase/phosphodiesterase [Nitrospirales bacterium]
MLLSPDVSRLKFQDFLEAAPEAMVIVDRDGSLRMANTRVEHLFGYTKEELIGKSIEMVIPELSRAIAIGRCQNYFPNESWWPLVSGLDLSGLRKDGSEFPADISLTPMHSEKGHVNALAIRDISSRKQVEATIRRLAYFDSLTNLPNRTLFCEHVKEAIQRANEHMTPLAVLTLDLDRFREINNAVGYSNGDRLLQQMESRIRIALHTSDLVARLGGDEFAILVQGADAERACLIANHVGQAFQQSFQVEDLSLDVKASIGIALHPGHGDTASILLQRAEVAMYGAKAQQTGHAIYIAEKDPYSPRHLVLMGALREGIERGEMSLHFQPVLDLATRKVTGVEALVRWQHPRLGWLSPDQFIPLAEKSDLIKPLSIWIVKEALRQLHRWEQRGLNIQMSVNLSARNLNDPQLLEHLIGALETWGVAPQNLNLEITESAIMTRSDRAVDLLTQLRHVGVEVSVDDFGIAHSSLAYLKQLPVNNLKIDRSFVQGMRTDEKDNAIVGAVTDLGHRLGLKVVAEGVEDEDTLDRLVALGCDAAQGFYICKPLPADELADWLENSGRRFQLKRSGKVRVHRATEEIRSRKRGRVLYPATKWGAGL